MSDRSPPEIVDVEAYPPPHPTDDAGVYEGEPLVTLSEVRWLIQSLDLRMRQPLLSIAQCTSSFFVLLFQHTLTIPLEGLEVGQLDTAEKKTQNMRVVLRALSDGLQVDLSHISAEEITKHNEVHISRLLRIFINIHLMQLEEADADADPVESVGSGDLHPSPRDGEGMVSSWVRGVELPPTNEPQPRRPATPDGGTTPSSGSRKGRRKTSHRDPLKMASSAAPRGPSPEMRARLDRLMRAVRVPSTHEPMRTAPATRTPRAAATTNRVALNNKRRDEKIERLRADRFNEEMERLAFSALASKANRREVARRRRLETELQRQQREVIELERMAKEEDARLRQIHADAASSSRHSAAAAAKLSREVLRHVLVDAQVAKANRASYSEAVLTHDAAMRDKYRRIVGAMCSWRKQVATPV